MPATLCDQQSAHTSNSFLFTPLHGVAPPHSAYSYGGDVIIIDALGEAKQYAKIDLLDLVLLNLRKFSPWVAVLFAAWPEVDISTELALLRLTVLDSAQN